MVVVAGDELKVIHTSINLYMSMLLLANFIHCDLAFGMQSVEKFLFYNGNRFIMYTTISLVGKGM